MRSVSGLTREVFGQGAENDASRKTEIQDTLDEFPGLFRKVVPKERTKPTLYTLHLRWALQDSNADSPPLPADLLKALLEFVSQRAEAEAAENQFRENMSVAQNQFEANLRATARNSKIAVVAAILAAILAATGPIIAVIIK
jgi:hypothetical protein